MKIAVCWSGQPRTVSQVWRSAHENLFSHIGDCDLFIHSSEHYPVDKDFWATLKPKIYRVEPQHPFPELEQKLSGLYHYLPHLNSYLQQIYGYERVWQLKWFHEQDHSFKYDLVIRGRPDVKYFKPVTPDLFDLTKINMFTRDTDTNMEQCWTDIFAIGPNNLMSRFSLLFDWLDEEGHQKLQLGDPWTKRLPALNVNYLNGKHCPETILASFLVDHAKVPVAYSKVLCEEVMSIYRG